MTGFFSRAEHRQFAPKNENEMKVNTPSVVQYFSFQTGKQVAEGKLVAGLKTKKGLLMSSQMYDNTFGPKRWQILQYDSILLRLGGRL